MIDDFETNLIYLLDGTFEHKDRIYSKIKTDAGDYEAYDVSRDIKNNAYPETCYIFQPNSDDRLFQTGYENLVYSPVETIGERLEVAMLGDNFLKWSCYIKCKKPNGWSALPGYNNWYELHYRVINCDGSKDYLKSYIVLNKKGRMCPSRYKGRFMTGEIEQGSLALACGVVEDANRTNSILCKIRAEKEILFPVPLNTYKEDFIKRGGPLTRDGAKKAIVHFVRSHSRKYKSGKLATIKTFNRGVERFMLNEYEVTLKPNEINEQLLKYC